MTARSAFLQPEVSQDAFDDVGIVDERVKVATYIRAEGILWVIAFLKILLLPIIQRTDPQHKFYWELDR